MTLKSEVLPGIRAPVIKLSEVISAGPHGRTKVYHDISAGLLATFVSSGRRFVFAVDYARYLVALRRIGHTEDRRHHLAMPENRPAHDPVSRRQGQPMIEEHRAAVRRRLAP